MINNNILIVLIIVAFIVFASTNYNIIENYRGDIPQTHAVIASRKTGGYVNPYNEHDENNQHVYDDTSYNINYTDFDTDRCNDKTSVEYTW